MSFCTKCGNQLAADSSFCPKCGTQATTTAPDTTIPQSTPQKAPQGATKAPQAPIPQEPTPPPTQTAPKPPRKKKKTLLVCAIVFGVFVLLMIVFNAIGDNMTPEEKAARDASRNAAATTVNTANTQRPEVGGTMEFGGYTWLVLDVQGDKALLITEHIIELRAFTTSDTRIDKNKPVLWEDCTLRAYLNEEFYYEKFTPQEQVRILETRNANENPAYGADGCDDTIDKVFLLSVEEANKYFADGDGRKARYTQKDNSDRSFDSWYLRTPLTIGTTNAPRVAYVSEYSGDVSDGVSGGTGVMGYNGVRPALWLSL